MSEEAKDHQPEEPQPEASAAQAEEGQPDEGRPGENETLDGPAPETGTSGEADGPREDPFDFEALDAALESEELTRIRGERDSYLEALQRLQADFENRRQGKGARRMKA